MHNEINCKQCGECIDICPMHVISLTDDNEVLIDRELCNNCGDCVETCLNQALKLVGDEVTVEELFKDVNKDAPFYRRSNGGVTIGGGEPTSQSNFVAAFLKRCKQNYIHTAMETCGYTKWENLEKLVKHLDLVYIDVKHMDHNEHKKLTGVSNELILENIRKVSKMRPLIIRIPVVPGLNDSEENITKTAEFALLLGENLKRIDLLPYHKFGSMTYARIGMEYTLDDIEPPSDDDMLRLKKIVESCGVEAQIGG
jgi:pyruvate formate lyase activating enzyme